MKTSATLFISLMFWTACSAQPSYRAQRTTRTVADTTVDQAAKEDRTTSMGSEKDQEPAPTQAPETKPETPAAPAVRSSQGSGGGTGMLEVPFTDSTGLASSYKINAPADVGQKIYGFHIHLHGDGGGGYTDFPNKEARYDLIGVTVKAPNPNLQWGRAQGRAHARYVNELIQNELVKKYNVNLDRIYFSGVSGGAYFLTGSLLPEFGQNYNSAALILCGGEAPRVAFTDPNMLSKFRVHIEVTAGERPDILTSIQRSVTGYKTAMDAAGIPADQQSKLHTINIQGDGGHCVFDGAAQGSYTTGIQLAIDTKFKMILPP
ncbi:hypothetical protein [Oligoflexus tunisiensis]|uniref:hypothetical protein n=1 Tax=Oligoflexus tunisiensis TaxID=708132 RepID=UPI00114D1CA2|nr:hypothetical protein [Oligoflexus tunisiensis]